MLNKTSQNLDLVQIKFYFVFYEKKHQFMNLVAFAYTVEIYNQLKCYIIGPNLLS